ncbi:MAG: hypothetical protein AB1450_04720 [Pseudomonadota bacterium]
MKRLLMAILLGLLALPALGREYQSGFGFSLEASDDWLVLTPKELKDNPELFNVDKLKGGSIDPALLEQVVGMVRSGQVEVYLHQKTSDARFADNVNFLTQVGRLPTAASEVKGVCDVLPGELSQAFGRPIRMYQCGARQVGKAAALQAEFDGMIEGTRSIQYQFQKSPSVVVIATATAKLDALETIRAEFERMIASVRVAP